MALPENILIAIISATPPTVAALIALYVSVKNGQKIKEVHISLNSRLTELLRTSVISGRQIERDAQKEDRRDGYIL